MKEHEYDFNKVKISIKENLIIVKIPFDEYYNFFCRGLDFYLKNIYLPNWKFKDYKMTTEEIEFSLEPIFIFPSTEKLDI